MSFFAALGAAYAERHKAGSITSVTATTDQLSDIFQILVTEKVRQPFFVTSRPPDSFLIIFKEIVYLPKSLKLKTLLEEKGGKVRVAR